MFSKFPLAIAAALVALASTVGAEPEIPVSDWHWLSPLDPISPFASSAPPHDSFMEKGFLTAEAFRKLCKAEAGVFFWIMVKDKMMDNTGYSRYALIKEDEYKENKDNNPFANPEVVSTTYYLLVQRTLVDGKFQAQRRFKISNDQGKALNLLGDHMTAEVGYPLDPLSPRISPPLCFGYRKENSRRWAYGEGMAPEGSEFLGIVFGLRKLPADLPKETSVFGPEELEKILDGIASLIRQGCKIKQKKEDAVKAKPDK